MVSKEESDLRTELSSSVQKALQLESQLKSQSNLLKERQQNVSDLVSSG